MTLEKTLRLCWGHHPRGACNAMLCMSGTRHELVWELAWDASRILGSSTLPLARHTLLINVRLLYILTLSLNTCFISVLIITYLLAIIAGYDITCQWLRRLFVCMNRLSLHLQLPNTTKQVQGKVPKFYFDIHGKKYHVQYSFNFTKGARCNEGKGIEHNWSFIKASAGQTVEIGPEGRHSVLDDFFGSYNYHKMTDIAKFIACHAQLPVWYSKRR